MSWISSHWLVLLFLTLFLSIMVYHAWLGKRRTQTLADYYVGGRAMGGASLGLSFFATYSSTNSFVGFSGQAYSYGAPWLLLAPFAVFFSVAAWLWIAPRMRQLTKSFDSVTIPDFIGIRFDSQGARFLSALIVLFASLLYMTAVFKGAGNLLEVFLEIPYTLAILIVFGIVVTYTATGGFISVVKTDVIQGVMMVVAALLLFTGTIRAAGGVGSIALLVEESNTARLFSWDAALPFPVMLGILVAGTIKFMVEPRQLSRFYALKDREATRRGMWVSTAAFILVYSLLVPIGLYAHRIFPPGQIADTDHVVPALLSHGSIFNPAVAAFLLVAMVAAAMSSLDSVLLVTASTCERDVVGLWLGPVGEQQALRKTRIYVVLFALVTALIALDPPGGIVALTSFSGSLYAACFFPAILFGLHWKRGGDRAVMTSLLLGAVTLLVWNRLPFGNALHAVFPALFLSTAGFVLVALCTDPPPQPEPASP